MNEIQSIIQQMTANMFSPPAKVEPIKTPEELEREAIGNYAAAIAKANTELMMFYFQKAMKPWTFIQ